MNTENKPLSAIEWTLEVCAPLQNVVPSFQLAQDYGNYIKEFYEQQQPIPTDIKSRIEAEYPHKSNVGIGIRYDENQIMLIKRQAAQFGFSIGRSEAGSVDWDGIADEFLGWWLNQLDPIPADISQWFKSRLQVVKVGSEMNREDWNDISNGRNSDEDYKKWVAPAEQGEVMSAEEWGRSKEGYNGIISRQCATIANAYGQYVLSCRGNEAVDKWTSVIDGMPELHSYVLVRYRDGNMDVCKYRLIFSSTHFVANSMTMDEYVTHWQPLPTFQK